MGANSSKAAIQQYTSKFDVRSRDDAKGLLYVVEKGSNKQFLYRRITLTDESTAKTVVRMLDKKKALSHDNIVCMRQYLITLDESNLTKGLSSGALYEFPNRTVQDERIKKQQEQLTFDEKELWMLLTGCVAGFSYFQRKSIHHSAVRSSNIYFDHNKVIKIADPYIKQPDSNFQMYQKSSSGVYLSPNELRSLREEDNVPIHNPYKSDVFAMGVIMLELINLQLQDDLYIKGKLLIHETLLSQRIEKISKKYSPALKSIISIMLETIENQRVDWTELESIMSKNQYKIYGKEKSSPSKEYRMSKEQRSNAKGIEMEWLDLRQEAESKEVREAGFSPGDKISKFASYVGQSNYNSPRDPRDFTPRSKLADTPIKEQQNQRYPVSAQNDRFPKVPPISHLLYSQKKTTTTTVTHGHKKQLSHAHISSNKPIENVRSFSPVVNTLVGEHGLGNILSFSPVNKQNTLKKLQINANIVVQGHSRKKSQIKKATIVLVPMSLSELDSNCTLNNAPKQQFTPKTIPDQNLIELTSRQSISSLFSSNDDDMGETYLKKIKKGKYKAENKITTQTTREIISLNTIPNQYMDFTKTTKGAFYSAKVLPDNRRRPPEPGMEFVKETYKQGAMYEGWKLRGLRHGAGRFLYFDGGLYDGEWVMNCMQGQGTLVYPNGQKAYQGNWVQDHFQGFGKLFNEQPKIIQKFNYSNFDTIQPYWDTYEGNFQSDLKHGFGVLILSNGQIFQGSFKNDYVHGEGLFRGKGGVVKGRWQKNKLVTIL